MSPEEYFRKIIELYIGSREPRFYNPNILRGRSASISSDVEDLTALFIALNNPNQCSYFTDQAMKFGEGPAKYPDVVIQNQNGLIKNLIDVKTDIGWDRDGLYSFCETWEQRIEAVKGTDTHFKQGKDKTKIDGKFSKRLTYHVVVISEANSGDTLKLDHSKVKSQLKNVRLYILSNGEHPNNYKFAPAELMGKININHREFERLLSHIQ